MNEKETDLIKKQIKQGLERYKEVIEEIDKNYDKLELFGRYSPSVPYLSKYGLSFFIEYHEKEGVELSELKDDYERINKKLIAFEQKRGKAYRDKVFDKLKYLIEDYPTTVCLFLELDPIDIETDDDLNKRDLIEILLLEMQRDYNVHDMRVKVSALDEALKCKFKTNFETLMKECPDIERTDDPESFWWRHPSKFHTVNK